MGFMKTDQEIRQMVNTCNQYHSCAACPYNPEDISRFIGDRWKGGCPNYDRKLVYAMGKGYGDVSEYKAEIERLKSGTKQAQIDVLNKLKKRARTSYVLDDFILGSVVFSKDIDELIKEVQNAEDKG